MGSVYLDDDLRAAAKASGVPLAELVRRGLAASQSGTTVRIEIPSARPEASAQLRSRSACSKRHAARDTRSSTRRSRRHAAIRSVIVTHEACPASDVQQSGHAGVAGGSFLTDTP